MNPTMVKALINRFFKMFVIGFISVLATFLSTRVLEVSDLGNWQSFWLPLLVACLNGGIAALQKGIVWQDNPPQ